MKQLLGALAAALALALAGCNGAEPDDPPEPPVTEASPDPTPTPEETFDPTEETAREFLERWFETSAEMQNTGEVSAYQTLFAPSCEACSTLVSTVKDIHSNGGYIDPGTTTIDQINRETRNQWTVSVNVQPTMLQRESGGEVEQLDGGHHTFVFFMRRVDQAWQVSDYFNKATNQ